MRGLRIASTRKRSLDTDRLRTRLRAPPGRRGPPPNDSEAARARGEEVLRDQLQPLVAPQLWHL